MSCAMLFVVTVVCRDMEYEVWTDKAGGVSPWLMECEPGVSGQR